MGNGWRVPGFNHKMIVVVDRTVGVAPAIRIDPIDDIESLNVWNDWNPLDSEAPTPKINFSWTT
jgi:hypothetical protein